MVKFHTAMAGFSSGILSTAFRASDGTPSAPVLLLGRDTMKMRITAGDAVTTATLVDSKTAQDFASLLPLTLALEDFAATEKIRRPETVCCGCLGARAA